MRWAKLGRVFVADNQHPWMRTHAANPVAEPLDAHRLRVYFSTRDDANRSSIAFVELDIRRPLEVLRISQTPVLSPGAIGTFDDSGVSMGCLVHHAGKLHLYYLGWNLGVTVAWRNSVGLAVSDDGDDPSFTRHSPAPVMDRHHVDPYSISYPWILVEGPRWRMWYGSNLNWGTRQEDMMHLLKYAESSDGIDWHRDGRIAIPFQQANEYAMSKPSVVRDAVGYRMWYSFRGAAYRIGYAESADGLSWTRRDEAAGITVSDSGWDAESVEYPCVFDMNGRRYMLYNGNNYGRTGFGLAVLDLD
jgi:predicted GH43/DUF377 family glycosyl hydrolase